MFAILQKTFKIISVNFQQYFKKVSIISVTFWEYFRKVADLLF